jgi:hypothetical protein
MRRQHRPSPPVPEADDLLDVGFSLAKANTATTLNVSGETEYRGPKLGATLGFDLYSQGQEATPTTRRSAVSFEGSRFLPNRWNAAALVQLEQNDELNLDYRFIGGLGGGRTMKQSNASEIEAARSGGHQEQFFPEDTASIRTRAPTSKGCSTSAGTPSVDSPKLDFRPP